MKSIECLECKSKNVYHRKAGFKCRHCGFEWDKKTDKVMKKALSQFDKAQA